MAVRVHASGLGGEDRLIGTLGEPLLAWVAGPSVRVGTPFGAFDSYGDVVLRADRGETAELASAIKRLLDELRMSEEPSVRSVLVLADENDPDGEELDLCGVVELLLELLRGVEAVDSAGGSIVASGE